MGKIEVTGKIRLKQGQSLSEELTKLSAQNYKSEKVLDPKKLSDRELFEKCQNYGANAKIWLRRFAGLLPEVHNRELYRKRGFLSIYEFAKKLAGMNEFTVSRILNLSARLEDKPNLRMQFESGEQGWSKIEVASFIATAETDRSWSQKVKKMSTKVLSEYVREYRKTIDASSVDVDESQLKSVTSQEFTFLSFKVSQNVEHKLRVYKQKLEKREKLNLSWNEVFDELMKGSGGTKNTKNCKIKAVIDNPQSQSTPTTPTRHIPASSKQQVQIKYKTRCAFRNCNKPSEQLHHRKRFSIFKDHNPAEIIPLCKTHHALVHTGLIKNEKDPPEKWMVKDKEGNKTLSDLVDQKILKFKESL